ncbi:MAG: N-6 DNA methylase, partial [Nitrososphaerota archaeon]
AKIVEIYKTYREEQGLSRIVSLEEVKNNDYNLNVTLYVTPIEEREKVNIEEEWKELKKLEEETHELLAKIDTWITEIIKTLQS